MTRAPLVTLKPERAFPRGVPETADTVLGWRFINPRMAERYSTESMGETGENVAERFEVTRADQDRFALQSHERAIAAREAGLFADEIVPVEAPANGEVRLVEHDEGPRADTTLEKLAKLRPVFREGGTITAGNASQLNDGAACVVVGGPRRRRGAWAESRSRGSSPPARWASTRPSWASGPSARPARRSTARA